MTTWYPIVSLEYLELCKHVDNELVWAHKVLWLIMNMAMALSVLALTPLDEIPLMTEAGRRTIYNYLLANFVVLKPLAALGFGSLVALLPVRLRYLIGIVLAIATNLLVTSKLSRQIFGIVIEPDWLKPYLFGAVKKDQQQPAPQEQKDLKPASGALPGERMKSPILQHKVPGEATV